MPSCTIHIGSPGRRCSYCDHTYCDADDHGHTKAYCQAKCYVLMVNAEKLAAALRYNYLRSCS